MHPLIDLPDPPDILPTGLQSTLGKMRTDRRRRTYQALYLMAHTGYSLAVELRHVFANNLFIDPRNGSLERLFLNGLPESGLVIKGMLPFIRACNLTALRLSDAGKAACQEMGWQMTENDWETLIQGHRGEDWKEHTAGLLSFCYQARLRGWKTQLLPQVDAGLEPDLCIQKGSSDPLYVEYETDPREKLKKWKKVYAFQRLVAIATSIPSKRGRFADECRDANASVIATDIDTLTRQAHAGEPGNLWRIHWRHWDDDESKVRAWLTL